MEKLEFISKFSDFKKEINISVNLYSLPNKRIENNFRER